MAVLRDVFTKTLWDQRRSLLGWAVGIAAVTLLYAGFYPSVNQPAFAEAMQGFPEGLNEALGFGDLTSAAGYLDATVFGILGPVLIVLFGVATGARAIAGDEEAGTLELVLTHPVGRTPLVLQRAAALAVGTLALGAVVLVALLAISGPAQIGIPAGNLAAMALHLALLGLCFGAFALALGAATGRRGLVLAVSAVVAVTAYFANTMAPQIDALAWLQRLSPFRYYSGGEPLRNGLQLADAAVLVAVAVVLVAVGAAAFNRRDVAV